MIILRNLRNQVVRLDLKSFEIGEGFQGFQNVPTGPHYIGVEAAGQPAGEWLYLQAGQLAVRVFNEDLSRFEAATSQTTEELEGLAKNGTMSKALALYPMEIYGQWLGLTGYLEPANFPPRLHSEEQDAPAPAAFKVGVSTHSRFEKAFYGTHAGNPASFLAEFQFAFVRFLVNPQDVAALSRWRHLLLALYNAGESSIKEAAALFEPLVDVLLAQYDLLPTELYDSNSFVFDRAGFLAEDMQDSAIAGLVSQSRKLGSYLNQRQE
jgi:hypothetical protein